MTSSLVGSEMCIRDSPLSSKEWSKRRSKGPRTSVPRPCAVSKDSYKVKICLLYTSDAADDM
eukprot:11984730-Prorocentrum_lima.AAC.1